MYRKPEAGNQKRREDGASSDTVDASRQADEQRQQKHGAQVAGVFSALKEKTEAVETLFQNDGTAPAGSVQCGSFPAQSDHQAGCQKQQHHGGEYFEAGRVSQPFQPDKGSDEHARQTAQHGACRQRRQQAPFAVVAPYAAGGGNDVEKMIGGADRGGCVAERNLQRKQKKGPGNSAHAREKGNSKGRQGRKKRKKADFGRGKVHGDNIRKGDGSGKRRI